MNALKYIISCRKQAFFFLLITALLVAPCSPYLSSIKAYAEDEPMDCSERDAAVEAAQEALNDANKTLAALMDELNELENAYEEKEEEVAALRNKAAAETAAHIAAGKVLKKAIDEGAKKVLIKALQIALRIAAAVLAITLALLAVALLYLLYLAHQMDELSEEIEAQVEVVDECEQALRDAQEIPCEPVGC